MHMIDGHQASPLEPKPTILAALREVSQSRLQTQLRAVAVPRHYHAEAATNRRIGDLLHQELTGLGLAVTFQGTYRNVVALPKNSQATPIILVGAHYDSVPGSPGADDNGSAVVALLECARVITRHAPDAAVGYLLFNREEDGLLGSSEFVAEYNRDKPYAIAMVHILEMLGYCSHHPHAQGRPPGLPLRAGIPDQGNFLAVMSNRRSNAVNDRLMRVAATYADTFQLLGLKVHMGVEQFFSVLHRSDHAPFWKSQLPALMWTDTAEFRNPHYHRATDTVETIDFDFLNWAMRLLTAGLLDAALTQTAR